MSETAMRSLHVALDVQKLWSKTMLLTIQHTNERTDQHTGQNQSLSSRSQIFGHFNDYIMVLR